MLLLADYVLVLVLVFVLDLSPWVTLHAIYMSNISGCIVDAERHKDPAACQAPSRI